MKSVDLSSLREKKGRLRRGAWVGSFSLGERELKRKCVERFLFPGEKELGTKLPAGGQAVFSWLGPGSQHTGLGVS